MKILVRISDREEVHPITLEAFERLKRDAANADMETLGENESCVYDGRARMIVSPGKGGAPDLVYMRLMLNGQVVELVTQSSLDAMGTYAAQLLATRPKRPLG